MRLEKWRERVREREKTKQNKLVSLTSVIGLKETHKCKSCWLQDRSMKLSLESNVMK